MNPHGQTISMWDSLGTFTNSHDLSSDMGSLMVWSAKSTLFQKSTWKCGRPDCPRAPGSLEQELLQILAAVETNTEQSLREHETRSTCEHNPEKNGPEITFCYKKLNTAGLPNALFVAFPCFLLFSNSIWIAFLFLASQLHKAENHLTQ